LKSNYKLDNEKCLTCGRKGRKEGREGERKEKREEGRKEGRIFQLALLRCKICSLEFGKIMILLKFIKRETLTLSYS
jgi:hypothetical protein